MKKMLYIKYSIYTNKGRKQKFPALSFRIKSPRLSLALSYAMFELEGE